MKMLYITSLSGKRVNGFMRSAIVAARQLGLEFVMACNMDSADKAGYAEDCEMYGIRTVHIDFDKNPLGRKNLKARRQLLQLMRKEKFDFVQCNTPVGGGNWPYLRKTSKDSLCHLYGARVSFLGRCS